MRKLTETEAAWLAGFIDADGCLLIHKRICEYSVKYQAKVTVVGAVSEMIYKCYNIAGGGHVRIRKKRKEHWKDQYIWEAGPSTLRGLLPQIFPYLCKKEQAKHLMECMELVKCRGRVFGGEYGSKSLDEDQFKRLEQMFENVKKMHL